MYLDSSNEPTIALLSASVLDSTVFIDFGCFSADFEMWPCVSLFYHAYFFDTVRRGGLKLLESWDCIRKVKWFDP